MQVVGGFSSLLSRNLHRGALRRSGFAGTPLHVARLEKHNRCPINDTKRSRRTAVQCHADSQALSLVCSTTDVETHVEHFSPMHRCTKP
jgi:hypothetical protein